MRITLADISSININVKSVLDEKTEYSSQRVEHLCKGHVRVNR